MSVSVSAIPFILISSLAKGVVDITGAITTGINHKNSERLHLEAEDFENVFNKAFNTAILDKKTLLKTLQEHGATNFTEDENQTLECDCEAFHLTFEKENENKPYTMTVTYAQNYNPNQIAEDIGSEYSTNAQEISYNKIKERLEKQNLHIAEEEIFDDNTIVLTVNLE